MSNIFDILHIDSGILIDLPMLANQVVDHQTERVINSNTRMLKTIEDKMLTENPVKANPQSIEEVINKVRYNAHENLEGEFTAHELRLISYYMVKLQGDLKSYDYALSLLNKNWRSMYFNGLVFYLLNSWNMLIPEYRVKVCHLVTTKLAQYEDHNKKYLLFKNHANFFEENGPLRMASLVAIKGINLFDAPTTIGYKPSSFSLSYYSDVVLNFVRNRGKIDLDEIESILSKHDYDRTKKLLFAYLVGKADRSGDQIMQTNISKLASRVLGDISIASTWAPFVGATAEDVNKLRKAKTLVNHWFARRLINVFFEVCVQGPERKRYWLGILEKGWVKDIRIVGSSLVRRNLQNDYRISGMFARYFIETNSRVAQTAAIILCVKNKVMIEFSDTGALYVYNPNREVISFIRKGRRSIDSIADLKITSIGLLVDKQSSYYHTYYNDEGRHFHMGNWQERLDAWMSEKINHYGIDSITFSDDVDDKIFKETPIETEKYTIKDPEEVITSTYSVPEYDCSSNTPGHHEPAKPVQTEIFEKQTQVTRNQNVEYHSYVYPKLTSKWIYNDRCRVITNHKNYYIELRGNKKFAILKPFGANEPTAGSIWIKQPNPQNYQEIVHAIGSKEITVGYLKLKNDYLIYRASMEATDSSKRINLN